MTLRFSLLNAQGLISKRTNKLNSPELQHIFNTSDVVLFTESWTDENAELSINNFEHFVLNRKLIKPGSRRNSGGLVLYLRNTFVSNDTLVFTSEDDFLWIKISKTVLFSQKDLYVCLCYVTPDDSSRQSMVETNIFDRLLDSVAHIENNSVNNCSILACGDWNARTSVNPDFVEDDDPVHMSVLPDEYIPDVQLPRYSEDKGHVNNNGLCLLDFCKQTGLRIMNGRVGDDKGIGQYTFVGSRGSSVVDYVLCTQDLFRNVCHFKVHEPNILSDHCLLTFSFDFQMLSARETIENDYEQVSGRYVWNRDYKEEFLNSLKTTDTTERLSELNARIPSCAENNEIEQCLADFNNIIEHAASPMFKESFNPPNNSERTSIIKQEAPWFDERCAEKKFYFMRMLDKYRLSKSDVNRCGLVKARSEYKAILRKCRYEYDSEKTSRFVNAKYKDARLYWNLLKETAGIKNTSVPLSSFEQYFSAVNNPADRFYNPDEDVLYFNERYESNEFSIMFAELNLPLVLQEILKAISQLRTNKSAGPDKLLNEFFINGKEVLSTTLLILFNKLFEMGYFPEEWSEGYIIPLHKKGSINEVENFRGITLLSTLGKLFSRVINNRLSEWAEKYYILIEAQAGFRPGMGTVDNIFVLHGLITHFINRGKKLYCCFIDFTKAFDYVVRDNLWFKLVKLGLRGRILNIVKSMYKNVKSKVKMYNMLGNEFFCSLGVRQGECLSPLLFSLFLNDIEDKFIHSGFEGLDVDMFKLYMLLYADDIVIFANNAEELQLGLNFLSEYCTRWKLKVNALKTKVLIFRKGGTLQRNLIFLYEDQPIEIVSSFKYLGIVFTTGGSFSEAQTTLAGQAQKAIFKLNKYLYKFTFVSPKHKLELFDKLISPILNYSCEVWGFCQANAVERVHMQFCKKLLGVKKTTQNDFIYGELGRENYATKRSFAIIKYWFKILQTPENKYIKIIYNMMIRDIEELPNKANWASLVRDLLALLGFREVWLAQGVGNVSAFLSVLKQRLCDTFMQNWHDRINNSSRANFYKTIMQFRFQPHLEKINVYKYIQALSKLRVSSHRLAIESGRWARPTRIPIGERKCVNCNILEDEFHFVIECNMYIDLRIKYIPKYYWERPSMYKFVALVNTTSIKLLRNLSVYVCQAFKCRTDLLYGN